jgi:uncharacterized membrane protein
MFQNQSDFNQEVVKRTQKGLGQKSKILTYCISCFIIVFGIIMLLTGSRDFGIAVMLVGFFLILFITLMYYKIKKQNKKMRYKQSQVFFEFDENIIKITSFRNSELRSFLKLYYEDIVKITELKDYLLIYSNIANYYIMEKAKMLEGNFDDLRIFLMNKSSSNYKILYKQ